MIVTTDIADILYRDCKAFGIDIVPFGKTISEETTKPLEKERIIIHVKGQTPSKYWEKCFCDVNLCVPDLGINIANTLRLKELERKAKELFKGVTGEFDETRYNYEIDTIHIEADTALKCHFINCRILFNALNVK